MEKKKLSGFQLGLLIATIVVAGGALAFGILQKRSLNANITGYNAESSALAQMRSMPGAPKEETVTELTARLEEYDKSLLNLNSTLTPGIGIAFENIEPSAFSTLVGSTHAELLKKYEAAGVRVPQDWYLGFEKYASVPAPKNATGVLKYSLSAVKEVHEVLLASDPEALINISRAPASQEIEGGETLRRNNRSNNQKGKNQPDVVSLPIQVSFVAKEGQARDFLNTIVKNENFVFTIDTVKLEEVKAGRFSNDDNASAEVVEEGLEEEVELSFDNIEESNDFNEEEEFLSDEKLFNQVIGAESVAVFVDINLVYMPEDILAKK